MRQEIRREETESRAASFSTHTRERDVASRDTGGWGARPLACGPPLSLYGSTDVQEEAPHHVRDLSARVQESWHHRGHLTGGAQTRPACTGFSQSAGCSQGPRQTPASSRLPWPSAPPSRVSSSRLGLYWSVRLAGSLPRGRAEVWCRRASQCLRRGKTCESGAHIQGSGYNLPVPEICSLRVTGSLFLKDPRFSGNR